MFVEALRRHLELARDGLLSTRRFPVWMNGSRRDARLLELFEAAEATLGDETRRQELRRDVATWDRPAAQHFVECLLAQFSAASLLSGEPASDDALIDRGVRAELAWQSVPVPAERWPSSIRGQRSGACCTAAQDAFRSERDALRGFDVPRYAEELSLTVTSAGETKLRPGGVVFLGLRGRDAMRWLLALEVTSALGEQDRWRVSRARARALAARRDGEVVINDGHPPWPWDHDDRRFTCSGLIEYEHDVPERHFLTCRVTELGQAIFGELDQPSGEALRSMARSVLADEAHVAVMGRSPMISELSGLSRHTKMVAHELRNALVPVQFTLKQLRRNVASSGLGPENAGAFETVAGGIERALRFVVETARMTSLGAPSQELFAVAAAIRDAIESVQPESRHTIDLTSPPEIDGIYLRGWRDHFVMALLNLLRNAVQAGDAVRIFVACELSRSTAAPVLVIKVEDDGPGVPVEKQGAVFVDGVSFRAGGTGHGLAFVREVIEDELKGSVRCEGSPRGGACFTLRVPIPLEGMT